MGQMSHHSTDISVTQSLPKEDYADVIPWMIVKEAGKGAIRTRVEVWQPLDRLTTVLEQKYIYYK